MKVLSVILLAAFISHSHSAPQLITFNDGKVGVNFMGYHAGFGLGGLLGGGKSAGDLFVEAGTPYGHQAKAGLGGGVDASGKASGGLYASAGAGPHQASAGLSGGVDSAGVASGQGHAMAGASGLNHGHTIQGTKVITHTIPTEFVKETEVYVEPAQIAQNVQKEFNVQIANEVVPSAPEVSASAVAAASADFAVQPEPVVKEIHYEEPSLVKEKHIYRTYYKPQRHHLHKTAYIGGYVGGNAGIPPVQAYAQPAIDRRSDVDVAGAAEAHAHGEGHVTYNKEVRFKSNPTFFQDIFNIPISTLKAVSDLLGNSVKNTNVSVQKSFQADSESISPKYAPSSSIASSSSQTQVSVETPNISKVVDDIFAIPINTLSAVNKFLENNVPARKRVQVSTEGEGEPTKIRLGPHARRRANKKVIIVEEKADDRDKST